MATGSTVGGGWYLESVGNGVEELGGVFAHLWARQDTENEGRRLRLVEWWTSTAWPCRPDQHRLLLVFLPSAPPSPA